jgi:hypothetical protein
MEKDYVGKSGVRNYLAGFAVLAATVLGSISGCGEGRKLFEGPMDFGRIGAYGYSLEDCENLERNEEYRKTEQFQEK